MGLKREKVRDHGQWLAAEKTLYRFDACLLHQFELLVSCDLVIQKTELMRIDRMRFAAEWFSVTNRSAKQVTVGKDRHSWIAGVTVAQLAYIQQDGVRHPGDPP